jgi:hypothetical protein
MTMAARALVPASLLAALAGCIWRPAPAPPAPSPADACRAVNEALAAAVPAGQSLAELQARGIRVRTPLSFAPGTVPVPSQPSGAAVQGLIGPDGLVLPGSARTLKSIGEPETARAVETAVLSMSFEFDAAGKPAGPVAFTTVYALCARS